jgi:fructose-bisphosphate aldolase class II
LAAERAESPVIAGFGCTHADHGWLEERGIEHFASMAKSMIEKTSVPAALLLNEAASFKEVLLGVKYGCNAVMLDSCELDLEKNISVTRRVTSVAHSLSVDVEGGLGRTPGPRGMGEQRWLTEPDEVSRFVEETRVDALAVSVGNVHGLSSGKATINVPRLAKIGRAAAVPLVIHGGTGFPDEIVRTAIDCGVHKFNVGTVMKQGYLKGMLEALCNHKVDGDVHELIGSRPPRDVRNEACRYLATIVERLIDLYGSRGESWT